MAEHQFVSTAPVGECMDNARTDAFHTMLVADLVRIEDQWACHSVTPFAQRDRWRNDPVDVVANSLPRSWRRRLAKVLLCRIIDA